jgi:hypothetical protein
MAPPTQTNGYDCGVYILMYAELFLRDFVVSTSVRTSAANNDDDMPLFKNRGGGAMPAAVLVETGKEDVHGSAAELAKGARVDRGDVDPVRAEKRSMDTAAPWLQLGPEWFCPTLILKKRGEIKALLNALRAGCSSSGMSGKPGSAVKRPR